MATEPGTVRLGDLLINRGVITEGQLAVALRAQRDHPRLWFQRGAPWLIADLHAKNLVRAADGALRVIDLLAAPIPQRQFAGEPLLGSWLSRVGRDPQAGLLEAVSDDEL